jgi:predicted sugar kinase
MPEGDQVTVGELIEELKKQPQDVQVLARNVDTFEHSVMSVYQFNNGPVLIDASGGEEYEG